MDSKKICFIINTGEDAVYNEMLQYLAMLIIPAEFKVEYIRTHGANVAHSYNIAMKKTDAKYKIYLKSKVYVIEKRLITEILNGFKDESIGLIAAKGYDTLPVREDLWSTQKVYGINLELGNDCVALNTGSGFFTSDIEEIQRADGMLIATQYDFFWREDLFIGDVFYDNAQSVEFIRKGYKAVVLRQEKPWCLYDEEILFDMTVDLKNRKDFLREYQNETIVNSIKQNYQYVEEMKQIIVKENDFQEKLHLLNYLVHFASANIWGRYCDSEIEQMLYQISNSFIFKPALLAREENTVLHVMTEAYETGGHTRVVESWIKTDKKHRHFLIFTNPNTAVPSWLRESVTTSGGQVLFIKGEGFFEKSESLFEQSLPFDNVILHIHNYDLVPFLTYANKAWKKPIRFLNHSDHLFWVGAGIIDMNLNITEIAKRTSVLRRGIKNNVLLYGPPQQKLEVIRSEGIKIDIKRQLKIQPGKKVITSMAPDWRYTNSKEADFPQFVLDLLTECPDAVYIIIGAGPYLDKWRPLNGHERVIFTGTIPKLEVSGIFSITDLYVDSFANSSGGCLADAVVYGLPVVSLNCDRVDALIPFNKKSVEDLKAEIIMFLQIGSMADMALKQKKYDEYYGLKSWLKKLDEVYDADIKHKFHHMELIEFQIEDIDIETARQFNPKHALLAPATYPLNGVYFSRIIEKIEDIYRIHYEYDKE